MPVVLSSTFHAGGPVAYARTSNPTWEALEEVIGALEGGRCLTFASGMGAVSAVLDIVPAGGVVVVSSHSYSGVAARLRDLEAAGRVAVRLVAVNDPDSVAAACDGAALLWIESPTNPAMEVCDLAAAAAAARAHGVRSVCDNTFATPLVQRPLDLGVDVVLHSATKSLAGHSDVLMGALVTNDDATYDDLLRARTLIGSIPGPFEAWLALRGIRTLALRLRQAQASAAVLAERLQGHSAVPRVRYPGLPTDVGHAIAAQQMRGFGVDRRVRHDRFGRRRRARSATPSSSSRTPPASAGSRPSWSGVAAGPRSVPTSRRRSSGSRSASRTSRTCGRTSAARSTRSWTDRAQVTSASALVARVMNAVSI